MNLRALQTPIAVPPQADIPRPDTEHTGRLALRNRQFGAARTAATRRRVWAALQAGLQTVHDIALQVGTQKVTVRRHLTALRADGDVRRVGPISNPTYQLVSHARQPRP